MGQQPVTTVAYNRFRGCWSEVRQVPGASDGFYSREFIQHFDGDILMENVEFSTSPGFAYGCSLTGVLGFASGSIIGNVYSVPRERLREMIAMKFNGTDFVRRDTGAVVTRCKRLVLTDRGAYVELMPEEVVRKAPARDVCYLPPRVTVHADEDLVGV